MAAGSVARRTGPAVVLAFVLGVPGCSGGGDPGGMALVRKLEERLISPMPLDKPEHVGRRGGMRIWLVLGTGDGPARNADATIGHDEDAVLGVVIRRSGGFYSDLAQVEIDGQRVHPVPMDELDGWKSVWWYKVESAKVSYRNSDRNRGWWAGLEYEESLDSVGRDVVRPVDVSPLRLGGMAWDGVPVGTMRYRVAVEFRDFVLSTPGAQSVEKGGVLPDVRRVSRKGGTGVPSVDHAMSLANLPYIWGSAHVHGKSVPGSHQAEMYIGADCADLVIASWRLSGASRAGYSAVIPLIRAHSGSPFLRMIAGEDDGVLRDDAGAIPFGESGVEPGSALLWRFGKSGRKGHAALLVEDRGKDGRPDSVLDTLDLVIHTMWDTPVLETVGEVLEGLAPVAVLSPVIE